VVLAGESGLGNAVAGLNVMGFPDIQSYVKADELLITTGFPLASLTSAEGGEREQALVQLIRDLHSSRLSGIAVKLGRYLDEVPRRALDDADELGSPRRAATRRRDLRRHLQGDARQPFHPVGGPRPHARRTSQD